jgi:hypothetical protein
MSWLWNRPAVSVSAPSSAAPSPAAEAPRDAGQYHPLYVYLRDRYADRVVLSFADIEALLGFSLPEPARQARDWWAEPDRAARASAQSGAWTLASRSAKVDVGARHVVFDRLTPASNNRAAP